jgi:hypothetical protein
MHFIMIYLEFQEFLPLWSEINFVPHSDDRLPRQTLANEMRRFAVSANQSKARVLRLKVVMHRVLFTLPS